MDFILKLDERRDANLRHNLEQAVDRLRQGVNIDVM